jgi:hypothetical protein
VSARYFPGVIFVAAGFAVMLSLRRKPVALRRPRNMAAVNNPIRLM